MARPSEEGSSFGGLLRQAEAASKNLSSDELPEALGSIERLRALLWSRFYIKVAASPARPADEYRSELAEVIRALKTAALPAKRAEGRTPDGLLTVPQAADLLALRVSTIRSWLSQRRLPAVKLGRSARIKENDVRKLIEDSYFPARAQRPG